MARLEVLRQVAPEVLAAVQDLVARASDPHRPRPLDDHHTAELHAGGRPGFAAVAAWAPPGPGAGTPGAERLVAWAQLARTADGSSLEIVVDPDGDGDATVPELLGAALDVVDPTGRPVHWWVRDGGPGGEDLALRAGFRAGRVLHQMRARLPVADPGVESAEVRPFRVGQDEAAWLELNNRAFAGHPEQAGWDLALLRSRMAEPWFDPAGFLLHERAGRLAGFCWTKVHADADPIMGEIYAIAVDPDLDGRGLGRRMVVAGLASIAERGIGTGMLYVDDANAAAMALYARLGFRPHRTDRAFVHA